MSQRRRQSWLLCPSTISSQFHPSAAPFTHEFFRTSHQGSVIAMVADDRKRYGVEVELNAPETSVGKSPILIREDRRAAVLTA